MKQELTIFSGWILVVLFLAAPVYAEQSTEEQSAEEDLHSIHLRLGGGYSRFTPAGLELDKKAGLRSSFGTDVFPISSPVYYAGAEHDSFYNPSYRYALEYRYDDRIRFSYRGNQMIDDIGGTTVDQRVFDMFERQTVGLGYYHPATDWFRLGISLQYEDLETMSSIEYHAIEPGMSSIAYFTDRNHSIHPLSSIHILWQDQSGFTPSAGFEVEPVDWFLLSYTYEKQMLGGEAWNSNLEFGDFNHHYSTGSLSVTLATNYILGEISRSDSDFDGHRHVLDLQFRPVDWLVLHVGQTYERYTISYSAAPGISVIDYRGDYHFNMIYEPNFSYQKINGTRNETYLDFEFRVKF